MSSNIIKSSSNVTLYAIGSSMEVTTHNWEFKSKSSGKASYNLIKIVGAFGSVLSNWMLFAIDNALSPKFK